ncbi:bifunctional 5,10-methylenetetrahydrofolate dehydrogenase/5,10-methenyltetrahydrofolate cyclohydrolase [Labrys wisconsinensis]|uniref:Bifunctional protein FolD n=1 Tax=Labrys wisconsinensis TaxID=425677 RepID=A0ABU0J149_9HYPH|nr:bifunctional methylenetetrahydrofolate dehydrogenase/methenyltetrahydrofolate cyclohydrolase FolD [Labrys wisconsinensis]MDQ0467973.1 methylenetetrahydrofolate dehydrogenase (NADP+)/methenyltetrahydrofolate cyclohydrolase [Labrys wisconsinensis]
MTTLIDGNVHAAALRARTKARAEAFAAHHGRQPRLDVVIVGDHPASRAYVRTKTRMAHETAIDGRLIELPETVTAEALLAEIARLNADPTVDGILVQLPLPGHLDGQMMIGAIHPDKDVDGFHPLNVGKLYTATKIDPERMLIPCTPLGSLMMLHDTLGPKGLAGKAAVVVGRSNIVGKPMAQLLLANDCTVTTAHSRTGDLPAVCREADILVAAVGRPEMVRGDWIKPGAVVIDVGINRVPTEDGKGRIVGDVATAEAMGRAAHITPVPGGVGKMTVACLLHNTVVAAQARAELV